MIKGGREGEKRPVKRLYPECRNWRDYIKDGAGKVRVEADKVRGRVGIMYSLALGAVSV